MNASALRLGSLCSGYGGLDLAAAEVLGTEPVWHAETDPGASAILARHWPTVPNLGDISAVDFRAVEPVDVLTAGFPCQDVSSAGLRAGIAPGTRSGLWAHVARAAAALRPSLLVIENVRGLLSARAHSDVEPCPWCLGDTDAKPPLRALGAVLGDLADIGFDAEWTGLPAAHVLAPHQRFRVFALAWPAAPFPADLGPQRSRDARQRWRGPAHNDRPAPHPEGHGRHERRAEPARQQGRPDLAVGGSEAAADAGRRGLEGREAGHSAEPPLHLADADRSDVAWGPYGPAVQRWADVLGRPAPAPTDPEGRLAPRFVEWLMGLDEGWVTDTQGLSRSAQLRALGNGVVPRQAAAALRLLLDRAPAGILPDLAAERRAA
ncbi:DNA (cytosine-5)-methyltransferase 1 [Streptacidiphilus sp. BW17]|uniref:DNA cytosine methyltransferase n=1 Tax=Streptacidiphilus sp. BW17 TaxID=3156274 RepID=UPI0035117161